MITFTIDLEDPTEEYDLHGRYVLMTRRILDLCDRMKCRATFFTVGYVARAVPDLIKDINTRGHEVAYHSHAHVPLTKEDPERFRRESREDKDFIEQLIGKPITGFRAPAFSLTPQTLWAVNILGELGFKYSSSIMPTKLSRYGFSSAPRTPFRWPNGLIELPLPVGNLGPLPVPFLGGIYMYALPLPLVTLLAKQAGPDEILWTYTHPYDFDSDEKFIPDLHGSLWASSILWLARHVAEKKIGKVLELGSSAPLGERILNLTIPDSHS